MTKPDRDFVTEAVRRANAHPDTGIREVIEQFPIVYAVWNEGDDTYIAAVKGARNIAPPSPLHVWTAVPANNAEEAAALALVFGDGSQLSPQGATQ